MRKLIKEEFDKKYRINDEKLTGLENKVDKNFSAINNSIDKKVQDRIEKKTGSIINKAEYN